MFLSHRPSEAHRAVPTPPTITTLAHFNALSKMGSVERILDLLNKQALVEAASSFAGSPTCQIDSSPSSITPGYIIFVIAFPDRDERWAARIPLDQDESFELCIAPLKLANRSANVPAPRLYGYSECGPNNPVGVGYMLLDWVEGSSLMPWDHVIPSPPNRLKILHQVADLILNLITKCLPDDSIIYYGMSTLLLLLGCSDLSRTP